jgi:hypothetical protein
MRASFAIVEAEYVLAGPCKATHKAAGGPRFAKPWYEHSPSHSSASNSDDTSAAREERRQKMDFSEIDSVTRLCQLDRLSRRARAPSPFRPTVEVVSAKSAVFTTWLKAPAGRLVSLPPAPSLPDCHSVMVVYR